MLLILLAVFLYSLLHSLLASRRAKALARLWFGPAADRWYRLFYNLVGTVTLIPLLALPLLLPDRTLYRVPEPWSYLMVAGMGVSALAIAFTLLQTGALRFLGVRQIFEPASADDSKDLVVTGLYRFVRHPLYTASLIFLWLTPVMTANLFALYTGFSLYLVIGAKIEERKLVAEFGSAYKRYREQTPFLIPWVNIGKEV